MHGPKTRTVEGTGTLLLFFLRIFHIRYGSPPVRRSRYAPLYRDYLSSSRSPALQIRYVDLRVDLRRPMIFYPPFSPFTRRRTGKEGEGNGTALFSAGRSHVRAGRILSTFSKKRVEDERTDGRARRMTGRGSRTSRGPSVSLFCGALTSRQDYSSFEVIPR